MIYFKDRWVEIYHDTEKDVISRLDDKSIQTVCAMFPVGDVKQQIDVLNSTWKPLLDRGVVFWRLPNPTKFIQTAEKEGWLVKMAIPQVVGGVVVLTKQKDHIWGEAEFRLDAPLEKLVEVCIGLSSESFTYGAILDPFGGDHTVAMVGKKLWRRTIVVDEHERCCETIMQRIKDD